eukprot:TRINITY_DN27908_c0_g1_i1.p1 TRINITY_DN27908_c0_g1~~TRINITY_DN27908_c0_g1_i1.p1  ORF type:complete len:471 (-),score=53.53 TRINITY_DN27908_c0_g1_i1:29-1375(-)
MLFCFDVFGRRSIAFVISLLLQSFARRVYSLAVVDVSPCFRTERTVHGCSSALGALDATFQLSGMAVVLGLESAESRNPWRSSSSDSVLDDTEQDLRSAVVELFRITDFDAAALQELRPDNLPAWTLATQRDNGCLAAWAVGPGLEGGAPHGNDTANVLEVEGVLDAATRAARLASDAFAVQTTEVLEFGRGAAGAAVAPSTCVSGWAQGTLLGEKADDRARGGEAGVRTSGAARMQRRSPSLASALAKLRRAVLADYVAFTPLREALALLTESALQIPPGTLRRNIQPEAVGYRVHHFPEVRGDLVRRADSGATWYYHPHYDAGALRLLRLDPRSPRGLQVKLPGDTWLDVPYLPRSVVLLVGDTLERVTNGRWRAALHRVLGSSEDGRGRTTLRMSAFTFRPDSVLSCLPGCCEHSAFRFPNLTARELMSHYRDNGVLLEPLGTLF